MNIVRVAFDMDDTLLAEATKRNRTVLDCSTLIIQHLGWRAPYLEQLLTRQRITHKSLTQRFGCHPDQYVQSWIDTLIHFGGTDEGFIANSIGRLARDAYQPPHKLVPGAIQTLRHLSRDPRFELYLVTIGDEEIQKNKAKTSGLQDFFPDERIFVVPKNKTATLRRIAGDRPDRTAMVGNSVRSDMYPAQEVGVLPIWLPCGAASFYYEDYLNPHLDDWLNPGSITEVPELLEQHFFSE